MCMEDIKIGRNLQSEARLTSGALADTQVLGPSDNRVAIVFSGDGVNTIAVGPQTITTGNAAGFILTPTNPVLKLTIEEVGNMITQSWKASSAAVAPVLAIISSNLPARKPNELS